MNPYWLDFQALKRGDGPYSDSTMATIIFRSKLNALMKFIRSGKMLGNVSAFVWRIEYQKRGLPHAHILLWTDYDTSNVAAIEKVVNVRLPRYSPFPDDHNSTSDFRTLIQHYQLHKHSKRCLNPDKSCRYGYPQPVAEATVIRRHQYSFARDKDEENVVPHNPEILAAFRCHHCLETIHSDQCIGYILKYCSKNSDDGQVSLEHVRYEGRPVNRNERLEYFAATRISSACECFAGICGYWRHHLKPTVNLLTIHLQGKKIVLASDRDDEQMKADIPSRLERYFGRPTGQRSDALRYTDYYSMYVVDSKRGSENPDQDQCDPVQYANRRKTPIICIINSVNIRDSELFALRLLLRLYPARSWEELRTRDGQVFATYDMTVKYLGLVQNTDDEARISMFDAIALKRPPSDLRFLFAQIVPYVSDKDGFKSRFWTYFFDDGDTDESVGDKIDHLMHPECHPSPEVLTDLSHDQPLSSLTREQRKIALRIIKSVLGNKHQLLFLQGSAGTGKTFTVKALIAELARKGKKCLITGTTGIAAVQYRGRTTRHSLFKLGIDETTRGDFRSNLGRDICQSRHILSADLIVIDEFSMLTSWVAHRVSLPLRSISDQGEAPFSGKKILFVGDLLQLPPVIQGFSIPVLHRLITRLPCWHSIKKFRLKTPLRTPDPKWATFLACVAVGRFDEPLTWNDLATQLGVTVTHDIQVAQAFFCRGLEPGEIFPLDWQWICPTNKLAGQVNNSIQQWRGTEANYLGTICAMTELVTPLPESPGLTKCQQIDFIEKFDTPDLPPHRLSFFKGDALILLRNLDTRSGLAKGRRCFVKKLLNRTVVVQFDDGTKRALTRIPIEKVTNGMRFRRWQIPVRLVFAGTVHRFQGMTLSRAVVDSRSQYWEHGQLYVALSRVRSPHDLCILLPGDLDDPEIRVPVDQGVVRIVESMTMPSSFAIPPNSVEMGEPGLPAGTSIDPLDERSSDDD
jgi:hypothetical protein